MKFNVLKKSIAIILLILFMVCVVSCVNAENSEDSEISMLTLSKGGIVMNYPSTWGYSEATSQYAIMAISKLDSIDSFGVGQVNILIEKKPVEGEFYSYVNSTYQKMQKDSSFQLISSGGVMIGTIEGVEYIYTSDQNGTVKEHKAVWFEKGGQAYVLLYSAPTDKFEENLYVFDYILSDIQIA
ncbi:hypothetical protein [Methanobrevibacter sp.]|uniref:hypothetical protein n=1 Tax=Methanobrevibacter sp. TaxID=66852 RepID=UPI00388F5D11